ncbi:MULTISPECIES: DUF4032 domain-containing protein [Propionimicrobium]|uniref:DUF4032 domain-containing protein n=1 Tax=Propionimicrobium TaxID=203133 RepID=UPI0003D79B1F|nr:MULTISPECIES: DUF4032 domain-containing protein [Propionimicrobium]ETJ97364.1 lipopolysaccharide kinase, Kdo/WaaP family [Propionimicrobium sp. BV2F7]
MPRFLSAKPDSRLLPLPWHLPLVEWPTEHLVALPRGISRHTVRFIRVGDDVYAAKEVIEHLAIHEYRLLHDLSRLGKPAVQPIGVVTGRKDANGDPLDPILLTKHLEFALPYRSLFIPGTRRETVLRLLDAMVVLIAKLHLSGFMWGDISLSNVLFRRDAGEFAAYLVDAETGELHDELSEGQRLHDIEIGRINVFGDFNDLAAGGQLDSSWDPLELVDIVNERYTELWNELTGVEEFSGSELDRIENRVRRLNALGFDVAELDIDTSSDGQKIRIQPKVVDEGHHSRRLLRLTGLDAQENQARRLLNDLDTYRAYHSRDNKDTDESVIAHEWLTKCFEPVIKSVPEKYSLKRDPAQLYHEVLDYRWYKSQNESRNVPLKEAVEGYINDVLVNLPDEKMTDTIPPESAEPINPYDPSLGYKDGEDDLPPVEDPWEKGLEDVDLNELNFFDIDKLRAQAEGN